jgi:hypothetical protein
MYQKPRNLGQLLLRYWILILLAVIVFGYISGFIPKQMSKIGSSLMNKGKSENSEDSLNSVEQGKERQEILKY